MKYWKQFFEVVTPHQLANVPGFWYTQKELAILFQTTQTNISKQMKNALIEGEIEEEKCMKKVVVSGRTYPTYFYSMEVVLALGHRLKTKMGLFLRKEMNQYMMRFVDEMFQGEYQEQK